jgi:glucokinase
MILAGDIGGTKTFLALARATRDAPAIVFERRYASRDHADFPSLLRLFLDEARAKETIVSTCLGVAGPVERNRAKVTYLPWSLDGAALAREFGLGRVTLVNDFTAAARGIEALAAEELHTLQEGAPQAGEARVVVGAGTGLGVAALLPQDGGWRVVAGEGGHIGFAPADEEQVGLWRFLRQRSTQVSTERVLSGSGLVETYRFLCTREGGGDTPDPLAAIDPAAAISRLALEQPQSRSAAALDMFVRAYGAFAGDLALLFMARGGIYLAGGMAPKILPLLRQGGFLAAFRAKAEHAPLMPGFPIHVVANEKLGLQGALRIAAGQAGNC